MQFFESESSDCESNDLALKRNYRRGLLFATVAAVLLIIIGIVSKNKPQAPSTNFVALVHVKQDGMRNKGYYKLEQEANSAPEAAALCAATGGQLASITQEGDLAKARKECSSVNGCYVGLSRNPISGIFVWSDGSPMAVQNWAGKPSQSGATPCTELVGNGNDWGKWKGIPCLGLPRPPLCMKRNKRYYRAPGRVNSLPEYDVLCRSSGGEMAVILNAEENAAAARACNCKKGCWTGMARDPLSYHFIWLDGTGVCYQNWAPNEPSSKPNEGCAMMDVGGKWKDVPCGNLNLGALCQTKARGR